MKILFVEDKVPLVLAWRARVKQCPKDITGVTAILIAHTVQDALQTLSENPDVAVVLLDGTITQISGPRDTELIQHEARKRGALVIAISSSHNEAMIHDGAICGWDKLRVADNIVAGKLVELCKELYQIPEAMIVHA